MAAEGLRERKKRRTRQNISDIATGLFLERGFDSVTIAEIAEAAEVSVNTVYNYFPAKEDLFFDRSTGLIDRLPGYVRGRKVGESAAAAVLRELRGQVEEVSPAMGLADGFDRFIWVIDGSSALRARLGQLQQEVMRAVEQALREETGAAPDDPLPLLVGSQLAWLQRTVTEYISARMVAGRPPDQVSREALALLDEMEDLLGERVLNYAVKNT